VLAISRWYQISFPFRHLNKTAVEVFLAVLCILQASYFPLSILFTDTDEDPVLMKVNTHTAWNDKPFGSAEYVKYLEGNLVIFMCFLSTVASAMTIWTILRPNAVSGNLDVKERNIKSTVKITLLNLGNLVYISVVLSFVFLDPMSQDALILQTLMICIPVVQSAYNPVVYTALTIDIFKIFREQV
jgi:hypothetical protein